MADWIAHDPKKNLQQVLFPELERGHAPKIRARGKRRGILEASDLELRTEHEATTLDRVHAAVLLQAGGQANALSALYPKGSEEERLLDAMLLAVPR